MVYLYALATIGGWIYILRWRSRKQRAGKLLLVVGRPDGRMLGNFLGGIGVTVPLILAFVFGLGPITLSLLIWTSAFLTVAVYWFLCAWSKLEIRENGILDFSGLLKWQDIASMDWDGRSGNILVIRPKKQPGLLQSIPLAQTLLANTIYLFWAARIKVYLSPSQKNAVNSILATLIATDGAAGTTNSPSGTKFPSR